MATLNFHPPVIAHRGASAYAPENTMAAFTEAARLGIRWIEFDVMQTADGEPIIFHDDTLARTTNGQGQVNQSTLAYLQTLDAGGWFHPDFKGEKIPSLQAMIQFLEQTKLSANVEIKASPGHDEPLVISVLEKISPLLAIAPASILFSSFSLTALQLLRHYAPHCSLALLLHEWEPDWEKQCITLQCASVHVNHEIMTPAKAKQIKAMDRKLLCYTVNEAERAAELYAMGVDAVFSDVPDIILKKWEE